MGTMEGKSATTRESVMEERIGKILTVRFGRGLKDCTKEEIFEALMQITKEEMEGRPKV